MTLTTPDVIGLLGLCVLVLLWAWNVRHTLRVLNDPDHPEHEIAKDAIKESETRSTLDYWFRYD